MTEEVTPQDDAAFDTAFEEITTTGDTANIDDAATTVAEEVGAATGEQEITDEAEQAADEGVKPGDAEQAPAPEQASGTDRSTENSEAQRVRRLQDRLSSGKGRLRAFQNDLDATQQELDALLGVETGAKDSEESEGEGSQFGMTPEEFAEFEQDFPVFANQFKAMSSQIDTLNDRLSTTEDVAQRYQENEITKQEQEHEAPILEAHNDYHQILDRFDTVQQFIDSQPFALREGYMSVVERGSSEAVIDLISEFKKSPYFKGSNQTHSTGSNPSHQQDIQAALAVPSKMSSPLATKGLADKDDFDGAWDEAPDTL